MVNGTYLREQAQELSRIARACFDLTTVEQLNRLADELLAKARLEEKSDRDAMVRH